MGDKQPPSIEHQQPPIYYCWKYWLANGEIREGCTPIQPQNNDTWPDLNDYGWVYIAVPITVVFVLVFVLYLICSKAGKSNGTRKQSVLLDSDDSEDEIDAPPPARVKWMRGQNYPGNGTIYTAPARNKPQDIFTVVQMAKPDNNAAPGRKVPPRGGLTVPMHPGQPKLYPQLSSMRKQKTGPRTDEEVNVNERRVFIKSRPNVTGDSNGHYVNDPTVTARTNQPKKPVSKVIEEHSLSSSEEEIATESEFETEDENHREALAE